MSGFKLPPICQLKHNQCVPICYCFFVFTVKTLLFYHFLWGFSKKVFSYFRLIQFWKIVLFVVQIVFEIFSTRMHQSSSYVECLKIYKTFRFLNFKLFSQSQYLRKFILQKNQIPLCIIGQTFNTLSPHFWYICHQRILFFRYSNNWTLTLIVE